MSKHTPGPWDFSWHIQPNGCPTVGYKGLMVCMVAHSVKEPDQKETALANASLISAAPDLLDALVMAEEMLSRIEHILDRGEDDSISVEPEILFARAAIAKATGEKP